MKTYDETIDAIFAKGDAILEQKKKRSAVIKQTSYAVSGVCAAAIVGVGIWRITDHGKMPESGISNIETAEEATTGVTVSSSATVTVSYTQTTNKTSTVKTTQTSSTKTSGENKVTTNTEKTVTADKTQTSAQTSRQTTEVETEKTSSGPNTTVTTSIPVTETTQTATTEICDIFSSFVPTGPTDLSDSGEREFCYMNDTVDETASELYFVGKEHLSGQYDNNGEITEIETDAVLYIIDDFDPSGIVAVKFEGSDKYYRYINKGADSSYLNTFIYTFRLTADDLSDDYYLNDEPMTGFDKTKVWAVLTSDAFIKNTTDYCRENGISADNKLLFSFDSSSKPWLTGTIGIDPRGYVWITVNCIPCKSYFIGEEKAAEIIGYC